MSSLLNISICLTDIPTQAIQLAANGKKYLNLSVTQMQQVDQYGKTHTVYVQQGQEERAAKTPKVYLGKGKEFMFSDQQAPQGAQQGYAPHTQEYQPQQRAAPQGYAPQTQNYQQAPPPTPAQSYAPQQQAQGYPSAAPVAQAAPAAATTGVFDDLPF